MRVNQAIWGKIDTNMPIVGVIIDMSHPILTHCPICHTPTTVTQIRCEVCDLTIEGNFMVSGLSALDHEQLEFVEIFLRCEGKINRVEKELNISYPTVRARLMEVIEAMGYEPLADIAEEEAKREARRREILDQLSTGDLEPDKAVEMLRKNE
jgi:hypothetical protein